MRQAVRWCVGVGEERRLVAMHGVHSAANAIVNAGLIGSVAMALDGEVRQDRLLGYLLFSLAPFALAAPAISWGLPRMALSARELVGWSFAVRVAIAALLVVLADHPVAFALVFVGLVCQRVHTVALYSAVPQVLGDRSDRVHANARLHRAAGMAGGLGGLLGVVMILTAGPDSALALGAAAYAAGWAVVRGTRRSVPCGSGRGASAVPVMAPAAAPEFAYARTAALAFAGLRGAAGALGAYAAASVAGGRADAGVVAVAAALGAGGVISSVAGPRLLHVRRVHAGRTVIGLCFAGLAVPAALVPSPALATGVALLVGFATNLARQHRDELIQGFPSARSVHMAFVRWDAAAQVMWLAAAIAVTGGGLGLPATLTVVAVLAVVTGMVLRLPAPRRAAVASTPAPAGSLTSPAVIGAT